MGLNTYDVREMDIFHIWIWNPQIMTPIHYVLYLYFAHFFRWKEPGTEETWNKQASRQHKQESKKLSCWEYWHLAPGTIPNNNFFSPPPSSSSSLLIHFIFTVYSSTLLLVASHHDTTTSTPVAAAILCIFYHRSNSMRRPLIMSEEEVCWLSSKDLRFWGGAQ